MATRGRPRWLSVPVPEAGGMGKLDFELVGWKDYYLSPEMVEDSMILSHAKGTALCDFVFEKPDEFIGAIYLQHVELTTESRIVGYEWRLYRAKIR